MALLYQRTINRNGYSKAPEGIEHRFLGKRGNESVLQDGKRTPCKHKGTHDVRPGHRFEGSIALEPIRSSELVIARDTDYQVLRVSLIRIEENVDIPQNT